MEIQNYIKVYAEELLKQQDTVQLPAQIAGSEMYLARAHDETIIAHGAIKDAQGIEYKIGFQKK